MVVPSPFFARRLAIFQSYPRELTPRDDARNAQMREKRVVCPELATLFNGMALATRLVENHKKGAAMGVKLLPLSVAELLAHALELEREAGIRFREYAARMREIGAERTAAAFDDFRQEQDDEVRVLESAAGEHNPSNQLSPWEYVWRLNYMPEGVDDQPRLVPMNAREALQLATLAKRRAEAFYSDVAENARDAMVRNCAAEMAAGEQGQIKRLEHLLKAEMRDASASGVSGFGESRFPS
jgi:rubrerythrin